MSPIAIGLVFPILYEVISYLLTCVPLAKMFAKAGEPAWKGFVPFVKSYTIYKISWSVAVFWATIIIAVINAASIRMGGSAETAIQIVSRIISVVIYVISAYKLSKAFGHKWGFTVGLIFLRIIFYYIIAFGSSEYVGIDGEKKSK